MGYFLANCKRILLKVIRSIVRFVIGVGKAVKYQIQEARNKKKHRALIRKLGDTVYGLSKLHVVLPSETSDLINQINQVDFDLTTLRKKRIDEKAANAERRSAEKVADAAQKAKAKAAHDAAKAAKADAAKQYVFTSEETAMPSDAPTFEADAPVSAEDTSGNETNV